MTNILYMAVSKDGFIADEAGNTPWSDEEWVAFEEFVKSCDVCIMGRKTYEIMKSDGFIEGPHYIVATKQEGYDAGEFETRDIRYPKDMPQGETVGILGGGDLNGALAKLGVIDEIILDVEGVELKNGKRLLGDRASALDLEFMSSRQITDTLRQERYKVRKG